jgi:hypothetical protein
MIINKNARLAQSVERKPFKLVAVGSSPTSGSVKMRHKKIKIIFSIFIYSLVAQWLAHLPSKQGVGGSNPPKGSFWFLTANSSLHFKHGVVGSKPTRMTIR